MKRIEQTPPFQIELEFVYGCNLGCKFCGLQGVSEAFHRHRFMEESTLKNICQKIAAAGWKSKVLISGHGEPMLHPNIIEYVKIIKSYLPNNHLYFVTNGTNLKKNTMEALFAAGLNCLTVDEYTGVKNADKVRDITTQMQGIYLNDWKVGTQKHVRDRTMGKANKQCVVILEPIEYSLDKTRKLVNRCGSAFPKNDSRKNSKCSKPFREMFFDYEGNLLLCCNDFRREYIGPNISAYEKIQDLWNNPIMEMYRKLLYSGHRSVFPCKGCDALSYRVGLLPDPKGAYEMPEWTAQDTEILNSLNKNTKDTQYREYEKDLGGKSNEHNS